MSAQAAASIAIEPTDNGFLELSDQELLDLIDANAQKLLGISGEEFLRRRREGEPLVDDLGRPVPAWGPIAMLASLLNDQGFTVFSVPLVARTPRAAFQEAQEYFNAVLNKVLTEYRVRFALRRTKQEETFLSFFNDQGELTAVPLSSSPWYFFSSQRLRTFPEGGRYTLKVLEYQYRIQRTPSIQDEAEVRFREWGIPNS